MRPRSSFISCTFVSIYLVSYIVVSRAHILVPLGKPVDLSRQLRSLPLRLLYLILDRGERVSLILLLSAEGYELMTLWNS